MTTKTAIKTYPEHEKLKALKGKNDTVGDFIEWLNANGYSICEKREPEARREYDMDSTIEVPDPGTRTRRSWGDTFCDMLEMVRDSACVYWPTYKRTEALLAEFFEIDPDKLEAEKRDMLDACRRAHERKS